MREILFRGKTESGKFTEGYYLETMRYNNLHWIWNGKEHIKVAPKTVGQFTGLTDKNGKKIFEGDIGRYKQTDGAKLSGKPITCIGKVVYNTKTASFAVDSKDELGAKNYDYFPIKDFEVIGNIHDNPELLEV